MGATAEVGSIEDSVHPRELHQYGKTNGELRKHMDSEDHPAIISLQMRLLAIAPTLFLIY